MVCKRSIPQNRWANRRWNVRCVRGERHQAQGLAGLSRHPSEPEHHMLALIPTPCRARRPKSRALSLSFALHDCRLRTLRWLARSLRKVRNGAWTARLPCCSAALTPRVGGARRSSLTAEGIRDWMSRKAARTVETQRIPTPTEAAPRLAAVSRSPQARLQWLGEAPLHPATTDVSPILVGCLARYYEFAKAFPGSLGFAILGSQFAQRAGWPDLAISPGGFDGHVYFFL